MGRRDDNTSVPQTCPFIDDVIAFIGNIEWDESENDLQENATEALKILETIRKHNSNLRDFGNEHYKRAEEAEDTIRVLEREIDSLRGDIKDLNSEIHQLSQEA